MSQLRMFVIHPFRGREFSRHLAILALVGWVSLAGCGQQPPKPPTVDFLYVIRTSAYPQQHIPPFEGMVQDATKVQRVYNALLALPMPTPLPSCPGPLIDIGYHLTFSRLGARVLQANSGQRACGLDVTLSHDGQHWEWRQSNHTFWTALESALGVPESVLFPAPQSTGPSAPTPMP